ncbi:hypothetical protein KP22_11860 [Pectobacterium betavasculorum]|uniref:Uncharacterized protein n=1 Tax=Pectobacterium betavasculorum TaxID=55207 RepID=A0A093UAW8_9GAMM|nr:hypothetical protein KP22_11860 [Pectobacterium betavasculorum]
MHEKRNGKRELFCVMLVVSMGVDHQRCKIRKGEALPETAPWTASTVEAVALTIAWSRMRL